MSAKNAAGYVGKFGAANYTSVSRSTGEPPSQPNPVQRQPSKFFKSRNIPVSESTIQEEDEDDWEDAEGSRDKENSSLLSNISGVSSINSTVMAVQTPGQSKMADHLQVSIRLRPALATEVLSEELAIEKNQLVVKQKAARFDHVLGPTVSQEEVYNRLVRQQVSQLVREDGCNAVMFAYGPTGTGKTHTMGTLGVEGEEGQGVLPRAVKQVLELAGQGEGQGVRLAYYEVLKDETSNKPKVFDLLATGEKEAILVSLDGSKETTLSLTEAPVTSPEEAVELISRGSKLRSTEKTARNPRSSRSHAVLVIYVTSGGVDRKFSLVDLAGSESVSKTSGKDRKAEGVGINESLLHLGNVIRALAKNAPYIPHRSTPLTWVLRDSLSPSCLISMVFCISPSAADFSETVNTIKFAEEAKRMKVKPVPAHLLAARATTNLSFRTPRPTVNNHTIHTGTPSSAKTAKKQTGAPLNRTIGTPGKRARDEQAFMTPGMPAGKRPKHLTSTVEQRPRAHDRFLNVSNLGISMIETPGAAEETVVEKQKTMSEADVTAIMEPMMKTMAEAMSGVMTQQQQQMKTMMEEQMERMTMLMATKAKTPSRFSTRTPGRTPSHRPSSRATSSPKSLLAVQARRETVCSPRDIQEDDSLGERTAIEVLVELPEEEDEDIISGNAIALNNQGSGGSHRRLQEVQNCASPELPRYSSPPSSSSRGAAALATSSSPSVEEMERLLGINSDSPGANDLFDTTAASSSRMLPKKSVRRTTMLSSEIADTLADIRTMAASNTNRRRSTRVESRNVFYGSPSTLSKQTSNKENESFQHPLNIKENWKVAAGRQKTHNNNILTILNTANTAMLTKLPAVGPKSAFVLQSYRDVHDGIKSIQEIKNIPGIGKNFFDKFCKQNQVVEDLEEQEEEE